MIPDPDTVALYVYLLARKWRGAINIAQNERSEYEVNRLMSVYRGELERRGSLFVRQCPTKKED